MNTNFSAGVLGAVIATTIALSAGAQEPPVDCTAVLSSDVLDRTEVTQGINIITRLREDICSREFESATAAREYARSGGATFGMDGIFDFGINDAKNRTATNYTVSDSKFCSMSTRDIAGQAGLDFTNVVGKYALRAFESCVDATSQSGLWITYDVRELEGILTASILRRLTGSAQPDDLAINEVEIVVSGEGTNVECQLPGDVIATSGIDTFDVPIEVAGTVSSIPCTKTGPGGAAIIIRTSSGDLEPLEMLSQREIEARDADAEQTEVELLANRVGVLEVATEDAENWLTNVNLASRMIRSDLPGARTSQRVTCEANERVTACQSFMMPSGAEVCGTSISGDGRSCHSSGCMLPAGQDGYTLQAVCTQVIANR